MSAGRTTYAVIGDPVEHSLSPRIFALLFAELGIDAHYTALRVTPQELPEAVARVRRGALAGVSVTLPHKEAILPLLDDVHPLAGRIGAVNCVVRSGNGTVQGYNTDLTGFRQALEEGGERLAAARVVLLGAGGAARAAAFASVSAGAKSLVIANRSAERAMRLGLELVETGLAWPEGELRRSWEAGERPPERPGAIRLGEVPGLAGPSGKCFVSVLPLEAKSLANAITHAEILVNATSLGLRDRDADPLPAGCPLHAGLTVLDMVYRPLQTALLRRATVAGAASIDGLWMLVHQAIEQLRLWTGQATPPLLATRLHQQLVREIT
ncbi:shikimate dehydrogenase family protein [Vulgatibacter sp.]|uniref:shikimate dehydrogenase family protein n=1 Tax=Vulgatibacter sp. TaxID=1971226 RepID=UPI0035642BF1